MASAFIEEQRRAVPIGQYITSSSSDGMLISMNVYIDSSKLDEYINIAVPVVRKLREHPECIFCEMSKNPNDKGHVRILHGWTKTSDWFRENIEIQPWFGDYIKALIPIRDMNRARKLPAFSSP